MTHGLAPLLPLPLPLPVVAVLFADWKRDLLLSSGTAYLDVADLGDALLELLFADGCQPTLVGLLDYCQAGLPSARA